MRKFSYNALQEQNWIVKIDHLQIINGGQTCKTIHQTLKAHPEIDFSQVYLLIRLYEVSKDEGIIQDITYATNSQNPVDFRDLKSNDERQILLEKVHKILVLFINANVTISSIPMRYPLPLPQNLYLPFGVNSHILQNTSAMNFLIDIIMIFLIP